MVSWPDPGTRVTVRYRLPAGSVPPLTDAVGHLLQVEPVVRVRTKTQAIVEIAPPDVVALRVLTDAPIRTSQIRALEHAAAAAFPGAERAWIDGWLLRADPGAGLLTNSAVPLNISAGLASVPAIVDWYRRRDTTPRLAISDRLLKLPAGIPAEYTERVLVRDVPGVPPAPRPELERRRAVVSDAPDGTRWVGLSAARDAHDASALLAWGASRGATRGFLRVGDDDAELIALAESLGFRLHHRRRYVIAAAVATV
jgi:N-acetylglutamate synthase